MEITWYGNFAFALQNGALPLWSLTHSTPARLATIRVTQS